MKKKSKRSILFTLFLFFFLLFVVLSNEEVVKYIMLNFIYKKEIVILDANQYEKANDYAYIQRTQNFEPQNKQELLNIIYTVLNKGWDEFTFYCPPEYENCLDDMSEITNNNELLSNINNFVHPYNSFERIYFTTSNLGKISIKIKKTYTKEMIEEINQKALEIIHSEVREEMTDRQKIQAIHDYIINHTVYDKEFADAMTNEQTIDRNNYSNTAYGALINGKAICGGYTDAMAIFLNLLGFNQYKISSENHIWNYVYLDNNWYHLDLTWDDPVTDTGENILIYSFFLINTDELEKGAVIQHQYDKTVYLEAN